MRLNKYIAHYSSYSRREADEVIQKGFVTINGETEPNPAYQVQERDSVTLHGRTVTPTEKFTVIVYHKKKGELVTKNDPQGRRTVYESLDAKYKHFIPVGRLDFATEGLLLFTDASYVATALMESDLERIYNVKINGPVTERMIKAMDEGLELDDATAGAHKKSKITNMTFAPFFGYQIKKIGKSFSTLKVAITEGQNREIRRFFAAFDAEVLDLKRIGYGGISLNNLPVGKTRYLSNKEYKDLRSFLKKNKNRD